MSEKIDDLVARIARLEDLEAIRHTRYRARLEATDVSGQSLNDILARPV
jgi:hypothetical protein